MLCAGASAILPRSESINQHSVLSNRRLPRAGGTACARAASLNSCELHIASPCLVSYHPPTNPSCAAVGFRPLPQRMVRSSICSVPSSGCCNWFCFQHCSGLSTVICSGGVDIHSTGRALLERCYACSTMDPNARGLALVRSRAELPPPHDAPARPGGKLSAAASQVLAERTVTGRSGEGGDARRLNARASAGLARGLACQPLATARKPENLYFPLHTNFAGFTDDASQSHGSPTTSR